MRFSRSSIAWMAFFAIVFVLSLDFWRWGTEVRLGLIGLPDWLYYFFVVQLVLAAGIMGFVRIRWRDRDDEHDDR